MPYFFFLWNDAIIAHLDEHGISQEDFEYIVSNPEEGGTSRSSGRPIAKAHLPDGRYVLAVYEELDDMTILPVTAFAIEE